MPVFTICIYDKNKQRVYAQDSIDAQGKLEDSVKSLKYQNEKYYSDKTSSVHYYIKTTNDSFYCLALSAQDATKENVMRYFNQLVTAHKNRNFLELDAWVTQAKSNHKIEALKKDLDDTKIILSANIDKIVGRGEQLDMLVNRTEDLAKDNVTFRTKAVKLKKSSFSLKNLFICKSSVVTDDDDDKNLIPRDKSSKRL